MGLTDEERIKTLKDQLTNRHLTEPEIQKIKDKIRFLEQRPVHQ
jgi:hypothetical protein